MNLNNTDITKRNCAANGWLKLARNILSLPEYYSGSFDFIRCWIDLQLLAEWRGERLKTVRNRQVRLGRGQLAVSEAKLVERWSIPRYKVRRTLSTLEEKGLISAERINRFQTIITILDDAGQPQPTQEPTPEPTQEPTPEPASEPAPTPEPPTTLPAQQPVDEAEGYFNEFFSEARQISREQVCRRFHINEDQLAEHVRCIAEEWLLTDTRHRDYNDWARHIINTLNIRLRSGASAPTQNRYPATINNQNNNPFTNPTPEAYGYNTELADQTDPQGLQNLIVSSNADNLNALQLPPGATWSQIVAVANASAAKRHNGDRYTTKAERDAEYLVYVNKKLAKARERQMDPDYDPFA